MDWGDHESVSGSLLISLGKSFKALAIDKVFVFSSSMSSTNNFHWSKFNYEIVEGKETTEGSTIGFFSLSGITSSIGKMLTVSEDCPWVLVEENFSFEKEDCPEVFLDFLNNFSGWDTTETSLGSVFFLVTCFFVDDDKVRGVLSHLTSLLGARIIAEESLGEKYIVSCKCPNSCPPSRFRYDICHSPRENIFIPSSLATMPKYVSS